jgi:predicted nucleotidyltransferase
MQTLEDVLGSRTNIAVLRYLTAIAGGLSGNEIAARLQLQQSSVRKALERLVEIGVVTRTDHGRSAAYEVDNQLAFIRTLLMPLFEAEARTHRTVIKSVARACEKLRPKPLAVVMFGSAARGNRDFRDIDVLCVVGSDSSKTKLDDAVTDAFEQVRRAYKVPISTLVATEAELASSKLKSLLAQICRDGLLVFGVPVNTLGDLRVWNDDTKNNDSQVSRLDRRSRARGKVPR